MKMLKDNGLCGMFALVRDVSTSGSVGSADHPVTEGLVVWIPSLVVKVSLSKMILTSTVLPMGLAAHCIAAATSVCERVNERLCKIRWGTIYHFTARVSAVWVHHDLCLSRHQAFRLMVHFGHFRLIMTFSLSQCHLVCLPNQWLISALLCSPILDWSSQMIIYFTGHVNKNKQKMHILRFFLKQKQKQNVILTYCLMSPESLSSNCHSCQSETGAVWTEMQHTTR